MSEDSLTDKLSQTRPVLGDLTNRPVKRDFLAFLGDSDRKSGADNVSNLKCQSEDTQFVKQIRLGVETCIREKPVTSSVLENSEKVLSLFKEKQPCRSSSTSTDTDVSHDNTLGDEGLAGSGNLVSKKSCSPELSELPNQGSQCHQPAQYLNLNGEACGNSAIDDEALKSCSCSFCLKAAYIWSDLQYQDIKGRIAALKKSRKEASTLAQSNWKVTETDDLNQGNPSQSSKIEFDLTGHWKSLFCHMEEVLANESNQLQSSFQMLNDLRENCKIDLENANGTSSQNQ